MWVPTVYTIHSTYLAFNPEFDSSLYTLGSIFLFGVYCIYTNYDIDAQRGYVRKMNGKCDIWGKPAEYIEAEYLTNDGTVNKSILVYSGWWGVARHINYTYELMAAWMWSFPCKFESPIGYLYIF